MNDDSLLLRARRRMRYRQARRRLIRQAAGRGYDATPERLRKWEAEARRTAGLTC